MGIVAVASLAARVDVPPAVNDHIDFEADKFGYEIGKPIQLSLSIAILN